MKKLRVSSITVQSNIFCLKKNLNVSKASEHAPRKEGKLSKRLLGGSIGCKDRTFHGVQTGSQIIMRCKEKSERI